MQNHCDEATMQLRTLTRADARIHAKMAIRRAGQKTAFKKRPAKTSVAGPRSSSSLYESGSSNLCRGGAVMIKTIMEPTSAVRRRAAKARVGRMTSVSQRETAFGMAEPRRGRSERSQPRDDLSSRSNDRHQETSRDDRRDRHDQKQAQAQERARASSNVNIIKE